MFFLLAQCTLMGSLGILFDRCCYCCIYLFVYGALIYFVLCFVWEKLFLFTCFEKLDSSSYFFATICKSGPLYFVVLGVSAYVVFLWLWRWFFD
jgi:hypothetical protein